MSKNPKRVLDFIFAAAAIVVICVFVTFAMTRPLKGAEPIESKGTVCIYGQTDWSN